MCAPFLQNPLLHHTPVFGVYSLTGEKSGHMFVNSQFLLRELCWQSQEELLQDGQVSGPWRCQIYKEQGRMATELTLILYGCEFLNARNAEKGDFPTVLPEGFARVHWKYTPTH